MRTRLQKTKNGDCKIFNSFCKRQPLFFVLGQTGPYSRYFCAHFRIDGVKAMSRGLSGGKQVIKFANTSNRVIFSKGEDNFRLEKCTVRASTSFTSSLLAVRTSTVAAASKRKKNDHVHL